MGTRACHPVCSLAFFSALVPSCPPALQQVLPVLEGHTPAPSNCVWASLCRPKYPQHLLLSNGVSVGCRSGFLPAPCGCQEGVGWRDLTSRLCGLCSLLSTLQAGRKGHRLMSYQPAGPQRYQAWKSCLYLHSPGRSLGGFREPHWPPAYQDKLGWSRRCFTAWVFSQKHLSPKTRNHV